jgi:hypothetical protein
MLHLLLSEEAVTIVVDDAADRSIKQLLGLMKQHFLKNAS